MRKLLIISAALASLAFPANAQPNNFPLVAGAVGGTVVGVGFAEGWFAGVPATLTTTTGAIAVGAVAGIGGAALLHALTTPCRDFRIAVDTCRNGRLVR